MAYHVRANPDKLTITEQNMLAVLLKRTEIKIPFMNYGNYGIALKRLERAGLVCMTGNEPIGYDTFYLTERGRKLITKLDGALHPKSMAVRVR